MSNPTDDLVRQIWTLSVSDARAVLSIMHPEATIEISDDEFDLREEVDLITEITELDPEILNKVKKYIQTRLQPEEEQYVAQPYDDRLEQYATQTYDNSLNGQYATQAHEDWQEEAMEEEVNEEYDNAMEEEGALVSDVSPFGPKSQKYWNQRYHYFSNFDDGIQIDEVGLFSVTPEAIAKHIAERFYYSLGPNALVLDAMTGVGGNSIQFAKVFPLVFAMDKDPLRLKLAKNNAQVCGVGDKIDFICADYECIAPHWRNLDAIFLSPPWGGPKYLNADVYDISTMEPSGEVLYKLSRSLTKNLCLLLPKTTSEHQVAQLLKLDKKPKVKPPSPPLFGRFSPPTTIECFLCGQQLPRTSFSTNQLKRLAQLKCKTCVQNLQRGSKVTPATPEPIQNEEETGLVLEVEDLYLNNRLKMKSVYYGNLVIDESAT